MTDPLEILEALVPAFDEIDGGNPRYQKEFMEAANKILQQHDIDGRYRFKGEGVWNGVEFIPVEDFEWVKPPPPPLSEVLWCHFWTSCPVSLTFPQKTPRLKEGG